MHCINQRSVFIWIFVALDYLKNETILQMALIPMILSTVFQFLKKVRLITLKTGKCLYLKMLKESSKK